MTIANDIRKELKEEVKVNRLVNKKSVIEEIRKVELKGYFRGIKFGMLAGALIPLFFILWICGCYLILKYWGII